MSPLTIASVELPTGVTVPYLEQGDPSGTPMVLLHGYSDSAHSYSLMLEHLPDSIHAYALTWRGHGDASRPESGYGLDSLSADVLAFMDAVGIEKAVVVGHSGGSYTAQRLAIDHPERVLGVVLIGAFRDFAGNPVMEELRQAVSELSDPVDPEFIREFQASTAHAPLPEDFFATVLEESGKLPARVWKVALQGLLDAEPPLETGAIEVPTAILWGAHEELSPRSEQDRMAAEIPGAELIVYAEAAHCPHWEHPERAAADIMALVERSTAR